MKKQQPQDPAIESINADVLNAVGASMNELLNKQKKAQEKEVEKMAFDAVASVLRPFPGHAQRAVLGAFSIMLRTAETIGYEKASTRMQQSNFRGVGDPQEEFPTFTKLFGLTDN